MVAKYPNNLAAKPRPAPAPRPPVDYRNGGGRPAQPANDNVRLPPLSRVALARLAGGQFARGFQFGWDLGEFLISRYGNPLTPTFWAKVTGQWKLEFTCSGGYGGSFRRNDGGGCGDIGHGLIGTVANSVGFTDSAAYYLHAGSLFQYWDNFYNRTQEALHVGAGYSRQYAANSGKPASPSYVVPVFPAVPLPVPITVPLTFPISTPLAPGNAPAPRPTPKPEKRPEEEPSNKPEKDPSGRPQDKPWYDLPPLPGLPIIVVPSPVGDAIHIQPPTSVIEPSPGSPRKPVSVTTSPGRPSDRRPPRRVKVQRKVSVQAQMGILWTGLQTVSEAMDFIQAMHAAIPKGKYRLSNKASKAQIIRYMTTNIEPWKHVDIAEAIQNYINMQVGDMAAAMGGKQIKKVTQELGINTGLDRALRTSGQNIKNAGDWVPTLDIDMKSGFVSIRSPVGNLTVNF